MSAPVHHLHRGNALTHLSLLLALAAMALAVGPASHHQMGALLTASVILDTLDGRFARRFPRSELQAAIGAQLDSLVDAIAFGVAPVVCTSRLLELQQAALPARIGFSIAGAAYAMAAVTRLASFNLGAAGDGRSFIGLPTTLAGLTVAALLLTPLSLATTTLAFAALATLMLSGLRVPRPRGIGLIAFLLLAAGIAIAHARGCLG